MEVSSLGLPSRYPVEAPSSGVPVKLIGPARKELKIDMQQTCTLVLQPHMCDRCVTMFVKYQAFSSTWSFGVFPDESRPGLLAAVALGFFITLGSRFLFLFSVSSSPWSSSAWLSSCSPFCSVFLTLEEPLPRPFPLPSLPRPRARPLPLLLPRPRPLVFLSPSLSSSLWSSLYSLSSSSKSSASAAAFLDAARRAFWAYPMEKNKGRLERLEIQRDEAWSI